MADPYVYRGTTVLKNRENIRDAEELAEFERLTTAQRMREDLPAIPLSPAGYCRIHRHLFQDVYNWAGRLRTVEIAKGNHMFCRVAFVQRELDRRFALIGDVHAWRGLDIPDFVDRAAEHVCELNAIHPFREGNGRTLRAFLVELAKCAGLGLDLAQIAPDPWNAASRDSFATGDSKSMRAVIAAAAVPL